MSDFHPETWNPTWSVESILRGLLSFMVRGASAGVHPGRTPFVIVGRTPA
jgi:ubiquitin-protein ligase